MELLSGKRGLLLFPRESLPDQVIGHPETRMQTEFLQASAWLLIKVSD